MHIPELSIPVVYHYQPPNWNSSGNIHLTQAFLHPSDLSSSRKTIAGEFKAPKIFWSPLFALPTPLDFVIETHIKWWTQHVTTPKRLYNISDSFYAYQS